MQQKSCKNVLWFATYLLHLHRPLGHELFIIIKTNQFVRRLKAAGCSLVRHGGEHDIWYSPITGLTERVPHHGSKEVHPGLLKTLERRLLRL